MTSEPCLAVPEAPVELQKLGAGCRPWSRPWGSDSDLSFGFRKSETHDTFKWPPGYAHPLDEAAAKCCAN